MTHDFQQATPGLPTALGLPTNLGIGTIVMAITLEDLARRVADLEKAQVTNAQTMKWMVGTLGQIQAVVDDHTGRLDRIDGRLDRIDGRLDRVEGRLDRIDSEVGGLRQEVRSLRHDLPAIVADALRDVLGKPAS